MRRTRLILAAVVTALVLIVSACSSTASSSSTTTTEGVAPRGYKPTPVRVTGTLSLPDFATDPRGLDFSLKAAPESLLVVYFGYLTCPDICPVTMVDIAAGLDELEPTAAERIEIAFATVDIERDTGARITDYLTHFFPKSRIHSLRARDAFQLQGVTATFGALWQVDPHEPDASTYGVAHSGSTYVVDDAGHLVWEWPFGTSGPEVAVTLGELMDAVYPTS